MIRRLSTGSFVAGFLVSLAFILLAGMLAWYSGAYDIAASKPHSPIFRWMVSVALERSVRFHAEEIRVPDLLDSTLRAQGGEHYRTMCAACHGAPGIDPSETGKGLNPPAPELSTLGGKWSDAEMHWIITNGIKMTGMPAFGSTHDTGAVWSLVAHIRAMAGLTKEEYAGMIEKTGHETTSHASAPASESQHRHDRPSKGHHRNGPDSVGHEESDTGQRKSEGAVPSGPAPWKKRSVF